MHRLDRRARVELGSAGGQVLTRCLRAPPLPAGPASSWSYQPLWTSCSNRSQLARPSECCLPRSSSSHSKAVPARCRAVRRPPSNEKLRLLSCHHRITPARGATLRQRTRLVPWRRSAACVVSSRIARRLSPLAVTWPEDHDPKERLLPASCHLRAAPQGGCALVADPARSSAAPIPRTSSRYRSTARRPSTPLADPKTGLRREAGLASCRRRTTR